ncbi:MAG: hypothetical protein ACM3ZV_05070 [Bacillota bacterium]
MRLALFALLLLAAACRKDEPPAPTQEQSAQLNDAEDMLNGMADNEEGPADQGPHQSTTLTGSRSTSPSNNSD